MRGHDGVARQLPDPEILPGNPAAFVEALPAELFSKYGKPPRLSSLEDVSEAFVSVARADPDAAKAAVRSYVRLLKGSGE